MTMTPWDVAVATGLVRLAAGAGLTRGAHPLAKMLGAGDDPVAPRLLVGFGIRDSALGISALAASRPGRDVRRQLKLQAAFDLVDASVIGWAISRGHLPRVRGLACTATALASAASEVWAYAQLPSPD